jgi:hypothetical protein
MSNKSLVLILPASHRAAGNAFSASMGWQEPDDPHGTFSAPITADGTSITHYGTHANIQSGGQWDQLLADPPAEMQALLSAGIVSLSDDTWGGPHYDAVLAAHGLARWAEPED